MHIWPWWQLLLPPFLTIFGSAILAPVPPQLEVLGPGPPARRLKKDIAGRPRKNHKLGQAQTYYLKKKSTFTSCPERLLVQAYLKPQ